MRRKAAEAGAKEERTGREQQARGQRKGGRKARQQGRLGAEETKWQEGEKGTKSGGGRDGAKTRREQGRIGEDRGPGGTVSGRGGREGVAKGAHTRGGAKQPERGNYKKEGGGKQETERAGGAVGKPGVIGSPQRAERNNGG